MYTTDMSGSNIREKKLLLNTTKDEFLKRMSFHNEEEENRCQIYLDLKGVSYHIVLANYVGLNRNGMIEYKKVQNMYIYDKRIRNVLYKFLAALEERFRGYISNKYINDIKLIESVSKPFYKKVINGNGLSKELENLLFSELIAIVKKLPNNDKEELFGVSYVLDNNLDAVKELRNTVSHHRMLFVYEDYLECTLQDSKPCDSLLSNILNLCYLLDSYYQEFFIDAINNCVKDRKDSEFEEKIPKKAIIRI